MKKILFILLVLVLFSSCTLVKPGYVGIKVYLTGNKKGQMEVKTPGRYGIGINTQWYEFPTFKQNYVWTKDPKEGSPDDESFNFPVDGMVVGLDVGIEYSLEEGKIPNIFESYRKGVEELTDITIRNAVRDSINREAANYSMDSLVEKGADDLLKKAEKYVYQYFIEKGIIIHSLSLVSAPRYPVSVVNAITSKIEATQRAVQKENELREAKAEAEKKKAQAEGDAAAMVQMAKAEAEANRLKSNSITRNIIQMEWIKKWDGKLPEVSSSADFIIDMK
jgi:regulator of protease activity HflC (stomatin/prohibitin superfamily)